MGSKVGSVNTGLQDQALTTAHKPRGQATLGTGQRKLVLFCYTQLGKNMNLTCSQGNGYAPWPVVLDLVKYEHHGGGNGGAGAH